MKTSIGISALFLAMCIGMMLYDMHNGSLFWAIIMALCGVMEGYNLKRKWLAMKKETI